MVEVAWHRAEQILGDDGEEPELDNMPGHRQDAELRRDAGVDARPDPVKPQPVLERPPAEGVDPGLVTAPGTGGRSATVWHPHGARSDDSKVHRRFGVAQNR